jgi:hypothetical protein
MSLSKSAEKRLLTSDEFETVGRTHYPEIRELSRKDLSDLVRRLRDHRDKARDTARQQRREMRGKSEPRGATPAADNTGTAKKGEIFAGAVKRVNREIARHDQADRRSAQLEKSRHALQLKNQASDKPDHPKPGRTASRGMRSTPSKEPTVETDPREIGRVSQFVKKSQARRDRRS